MRQLTGSLNVLSIELDNDITLPYASFLSRAAFYNLRDQGTCGPIQTKSFGEIFIHILSADTQPTALNCTRVAQLFYHVTHDTNRNRKGQSNRTTRTSVNLGIHSYHFAF